MKEAILYEKMEKGLVRCALCAHRCIIDEGKRGRCGIRENRDGTLFALTYDKVISANLDPIEKKPLYHYKPGSYSYSIATVGCNFRCDFCQNHDISQWVNDKGSLTLPGQSLSPEEMAKAANEVRAETIAFTYTEPTVFAEIAHDTAQAAQAYGIDAVFISNGYMTNELIAHFDGLLKAANIDLKAFKEKSYKKTIGARLSPVLDSIRTLHEKGVWVEVTTLIVPGFNDDPEELAQMAAFIKETADHIPWHLSAFHPAYRRNQGMRTPAQTLQIAYDIGKKAGLKFVYTGNIIDEERSSTICPHCLQIVLRRAGFNITERNLSGNRCTFCGEVIEGIY